MSVITIEDRIMTIWQWCHEAYLQYGINLSFPKGTDPTKTYQWRYLRSILVKFDEWQFTDETAKQYIKIAVEQAKKRKIIKKGLAALHQSNMLEYCYKLLSAQMVDNNSKLQHLESVKKWLDNQVLDQICLDVLLKRANKRALPNIIIWYQASLISDLFMSLSKNCCKAISEIEDKAERMLLPTTTSLYLIRSEFLSETSNAQFVKQLLGSDWRKA